MQNDVHGIRTGTFLPRQSPKKRYVMYCACNSSSNELQLLLEEERRFVPSTYAELLKACGKAKTLSHSKLLHAHIKADGLEQNSYLGNHLVRAYIECGSLQDARDTFNKMCKRDLILWTSMIGEYAQEGQCIDAMELFRHMLLEGIILDAIAFVTVLNACAAPAALEQGKFIHACISETGYYLDTFACTALFNMYGRCGDMSFARQIFERMPYKNLVSWNAMLSLYAQNGYLMDALLIFQQMQLEGIRPDRITFLSIPLAYTDCKHLYNQVFEAGLATDPTVCNALVNMYGRLGSLRDARRMFNSINPRNVISWNSMIAAYLRYGHQKAALLLFRRMQLEGVAPNRVTFLSILNGFEIDLAALKVLHAQIAHLQLDSDFTLGTSLIRMYGKYGLMDEAQNIFSQFCRRPDRVLWGAWIAAHVEQNSFKNVMQLFQQMELEGVKPNNISFISILDACKQSKNVAVGKMIHSRIERIEVVLDEALAASLIGMYGKCGRLQDARLVFYQMQRCSLSLWNVMLAAYAFNRDGKEAIKVFQLMQLAGIRADNISLSTVLDACTDYESIAETRSVHGCIRETGLESDIAVGTALVSMYARIGNLKQADWSFSKIREPDLYAWNAMISAYEGERYSLVCYRNLQLEGFLPDEATFVAIINACRNMTALEQGRQIHNRIASSVCASNIMVSNALMEMYGACGALEDAQAMFNDIPEPDNLVWNVLISLYSQHGFVEHALKLFHQMQQNGARPSNATLATVLCSCCQAGLIFRGTEYFASMTTDHLLLPTIDDCGYIIDLLSRGGLLGESEVYIREMLTRYFPADGRGVFLYQEFVDRGRSFIEVKEKVYEFSAKDRSVPMLEDIHVLLERLDFTITRACYGPNYSRGGLLQYCHTENLAIAFGLLNTPFGTALRVAKSLRMCSDCHYTTMLISKLVRRTIFVKDAKVVHCFNQGACSCQGYW